MVSTIEAKSSLITKLKYIETELVTLQNDLQALTPEQTKIIRYDKVLEDSINIINTIKVLDYKDIAKKIADPNNIIFINETYDQIKYIKEKLNSSSVTTVSGMGDAIVNYLTDIPPKILAIENDIQQLDDAYIDSQVDPFIKIQQTDYENDLNNAFADAERDFKTADATLNSLVAPKRPNRAVMVPMKEPVEQKKPPKFVSDKSKTKADNIQEKQKYLLIKEQFEKDKIVYIQEKKSI